MNESFLSMLANASKCVNVGENASFVVDKPCGFSKKSGLSHITKVVYVTNVPLKRNYGKAVRAALKHKGLPFADFKPQESEYAPVIANFVSERNGKHYLQVVPKKNTKFHTTYYAFGQVVTDPETLAAIDAENEKKGKWESGTQGQYGLHGSDQIKFLRYALENVKVVKMHHQCIVND